jgi:thioredoxin 1
MSKVREYGPKSEGKTDVRNEIEDKEEAVVLFYATWCPFSRRFLPIFDEYSKNNPEECVSVIADDEPDLCDKYSIEYYPTVILFKKGKICQRIDSEPGVGLSEKQFKNFVAKNK